MRERDSVNVPGRMMLRMTRVQLMKGNEKRKSYYWYMPGGRISDTEFKKNLFKFYYGLLKKGRDLLFLRFSMSSTNGDLCSQEELIKNLIKSFYPLLKSELPTSYSD